MRSVFAVFFAIVGFAAISACSHDTAPPVGRWEGVYDTQDTVIAARLEITAKNDIYLSAPDALDIGQSSDTDHAAIREHLADGLADSWSSVQPRKLDFDGKTFRKPGGIAPQVEWDSSKNQMTLIVYLGTRPEIHIALHPVKDFTAIPFAAL
ncbi:MAG TPA: hypothetical protein VIJ85_11175 [Rhizomicrobium sp.]